MTILESINVTQFCEDILREDRRYNAEHGIWPSVNIVIDRLLDRELELRNVYDELHRKLGGIPHGVWTFLDSVLGVAALWKPEAISEQRTSRKRLIELNDLIGQRSDELANFIQEREDISNESGFSSNSHYDIFEVIEEAAEPAHSFNFWLKKPLRNARHGFDLRYWPSLSEIVRVLGADARRALVEPTDTITEAATNAIRPSKSDFVRALGAALMERAERENDRLPNQFRLSDESMASLVNCLLNLQPDEGVDGAYIKNFRQRERKAITVGRAKTPSFAALGAP